MLYEYWTGKQAQFDSERYSDPASAAMAGALSFDDTNPTLRDFIAVVRAMTHADPIHRAAIEDAQAKLHHAMAAIPEDAGGATRIEEPKREARETKPAEVKFSKRPSAKPPAPEVAPLVRLSSNLKKG
jgi:hypothetical protein